MKILNLTLWACIFCIGLTSFAQAQRTTEEFRLPEVPVFLTDSAERAAYLAVHYWDYFNFAGFLYEEKALREQVLQENSI